MQWSIRLWVVALVIVLVIVVIGAIVFLRGRGGTPYAPEREEVQPAVQEGITLERQEREESGY